VNLIRHRFASVVLACAGILLAVPAAAIAQQAATPVRAKTEKLMLSFALGGVSLSSDEFEDDPESGGGFSAQLGWGFTRRFTLLVDASAGVLDSDDEEFVLIHFDLLGRFNFANPQRPLVPFIEGGLTARVAGQDDIVIVDEDGGSQEVDLEISGGGFTFGGGLQYHVAPSVSFGASLRFTVGEFSTVKINNVSVDGFELDANSTRLNIGVTWWPMR
jgi:opacity protein-like surface antigen